MKDKKNETPPNTGGLPDELEEALVSALYLAGEALIPDKPETACLTAESHDKPLLEDFDWLVRLMAAFRAALAEDPRRAELLHSLPQGLADGENLRVLYANLFPEQRDARKPFLDAKGKPMLTAKQVEIIRDTAQGKSPGKIAVERGCTETNITNILNSIKKRLNASTPQEAVAVAISMNYLPLDVLEWVRTASHCSTKNYSPLDSLISGGIDVESLPTATYWHETASLGLLLMLASHSGAEAQFVEVRKGPANGVLIRIEARLDGTFLTRQVVGPGVLRYPTGIAVAPPGSARKGFTPGNVFMIHSRLTQAAGNIQEIVEWTPSGKFVRAFSGGRTIRTCLRGVYGLTFAPAGGLLAASHSALLEFTEGGRQVEIKVAGCCADVGVDRQGQLYLAHYSTRGGSIGVYSACGKLLREWERQPPLCNFCGARPLGKGKAPDVAALWHDESRYMLQIYNAQSDLTACWPVPGAARGAFALDAEAKRVYIACASPPSVAVYALDGTLQTRIALDSSITPFAITLGDDGTLWLPGVVN